MTTSIRLAIGVYLLLVGMLVGMTIERMRYDVQRSEVLVRYEQALHEWQAYRMALEKDEAAAASFYAQALAAALRDADPLLESYVLRHQGGHAMKSGTGREAGLDLLRRSYHLRAALGARPQTAAAAATLAEVLPPESTERDHLLQTAAATARELNLAWLKSALDQ